MSAAEIGNSSIVVYVGASRPRAVPVSISICGMNKSKITKLQRRTFVKVSVSQGWACNIMLFSF